MPTATANGITIEYETFGDPAAPPVLLIMGFAGQLTLWDPGFCADLADAGFYVIRYDNRDVGLSTWLDDTGEPDLLALLGGDASAPYSIADMAADAAGLLDALGLDAAHIVGVSMGGMIAQAFAIDHPARVRTLTSIMSSTGNCTCGTASCATAGRAPPWDAWCASVADASLAPSAENSSPKDGSCLPSPSSFDDSPGSINTSSWSDENARSTLFLARYSCHLL